MSQLLYKTRTILRTTQKLTLPKRDYGFIVLLPEIGENLPEKNPLIQHDGLPEFNNITIENCTAAIAKQTLEFEAGVKSIEQTLLKNKGTNDVFQDVFQPLENLGNPLEITWGLSKTMYLGNNTLMPTKNYLSIHERAKRARACKYNSLPIYEAVKAELSKETDRTDEEERVLKKFNVEGKLNGLELDSAKKLELTSHLTKLNEERSKFKQKFDFATNRFSHTIEDGTITRDFPEDLLKRIAVDSKNYLNGPWKATLNNQVYNEVMKYCPDRIIRWNLWQALVSRGSGYGQREMATGPHIEEIRHCRRKIAELLGYESFAEMSMETKMAGSMDNVKNMLGILLDRAKPAQTQELQDVLEFAQERGFNGEKLELWDVPYWRHKQELSLFNYHENDYKNYFPLKQVLEGLFQLCERLFDIQIKPRSNTSPAWHKDVKYYDIFESHSSAPVAGFYLDPYARSQDKIRNQTNNGWMIGIQNQSRISDTKPMAALIFNFEQPTTSDKVSLLTFKEVHHLFYKFGHAMQHLLTRTTYSEVAGLSNIEWDAVEISGHVLSHWLYNKSVIDSISCHYASEDKLPSEMFDSLLEVRKHLAGTDLCQELYLSALDLELYSTQKYWLAVVRNLWPQYHDFPLDKLDSHPCSFTSIFTDEWAAAYFSHVWSRVIAADVYSAFHEAKDNEQEVKDVGKRFRDTFLALGGSAHTSQIFRKFRGRDPSHKALLKTLGLKKAVKEEN